MKSTARGSTERSNASGRPAASEPGRCVIGAAWCSNHVIVPSHCGRGSKKSTAASPYAAASAYASATSARSSL